MDVVEVMTVMAFLYGRSSLASISTLNGTNRVVDRQERVRLLRLYGVDCIRLLREWGESLSKEQDGPWVGGLRGRLSKY